MLCHAQTITTACHKYVHLFCITFFNVHRPIPNDDDYTPITDRLPEFSHTLQTHIYQRLLD